MALIHLAGVVLITKRLNRLVKPDNKLKVTYLSSGLAMSSTLLVPRYLTLVQFESVGVVAHDTWR